MGVKISELTEAMAAQEQDIMPIVQNGETKKIEVQTLMTGVENDITTLQTNLEASIANLQNQINDKNIITANLSADVTKSTTSDYVVTSLITQAQIGNKLSINGGTIVIGSGISKVLVSGTCIIRCANTTGTQIRNLGIRKNNVNLKAASDNTSNGGWLFLSLSEFLLDVSEGDTIGLQMYTQNGDVIKGGSSYTYITVRQVD